MGKLWIALAVFLIIGGLIIKEQTSDAKGFVTRFGNWMSELFHNTKDISGHAIKDYQWLPDQNASQPPKPEHQRDPGR